ncbi:tyrosine-protein phosphatase non-receptor type 5 isoform X2 [Nasonia vitripennis]|uniref:protein-tyrosine-phosphatase n=1 Tax=Nasonia vitripennis TaxID=7425 RepID=A0A7M7TD11_NASVI|nr:tyrosine-protein phosphatase non-receptor type 5 isoform X2 [Nasonia vitripennis]
MFPIGACQRRDSEAALYRRLVATVGDPDHYVRDRNSSSALLHDGLHLRAEWTTHKDKESSSGIEGMSASSSHKLWRSTTGLDDAGMDLRVAQFSAHTSREFDSATTPAGLEQQLPLLVALCAIAGAILFAFLILLWLRQQMSREKDAEEGDRRGLVEEGTVCPPDDANKTTKTKALTEAKWVPESVPEISAVVTAASENISTKFEKVIKTKVETETRWLAEPVPHVSTACVERTEAASTSSSASSASIMATTKVPETRLAKRSPRRDCGGNRRTRSMYSSHVSAIATPERKPDPHRRCKGLLERRGSSASLTIDLAPAPESPPHSVTPTRECTAEEYLLSATNRLTRDQLRKSVENPIALHTEFWKVPLNYPEEVDVCGSGVKNRYPTVLPNARSRVILPGSEDPLTSYINANYVRGYDDESRYIATQGPLSHTIADFWSMAWAERTPVIIMITRLHEAAKTKCEAYFPLELNSRIQAGPFTVILNSMDTRGGYSVRDLEVRYENERRIIQHYWYDSWPDHLVPQTADALVGLAAEINTLTGPIIVHCSAGIGRTGCFIALATGMTQLIREGNVDILRILCQMRYDRGGMVQTAEQYEFLHKALCLFEETLERKTSKDDDRKEKPK